MKSFHKNFNIFTITLFIFLISQSVLWAKLLEVPYVAQFNNNACGAAALEMIYKYYGKSDITQQSIFDKYQEFEPEFEREKRIPTDNLISDAKSRGFLASSWERVDYLSKDATLSILKDYLNQGIPIIACQQFTKDSPKIGHFRVIVGIDEENVYFHDPKFGASMKWPIDQFMEYWQPTGQNVTGGVYIVIKK